MTSPQIYKLPFKLTAFTLHDNVVHATLSDDNEVTLKQGPLTELLSDLPVAKSQITNIKFACHCMSYPDAVTIALPLHLHAEFGSKERHRENMLYMTLKDSNGKTVISADARYIADSVKERGYPVSSQSIAAVKQMISQMRPHQKIVGWNSRNLPSDISLYQV